MEQGTVRTKEKAIKSMQMITIVTLGAFIISNVAWVYFFNNSINNALRTSFVTTDMGSFMVSRNPDDELQQYEIGNFADRTMSLLLQYDGATLENNLRTSLEWTTEEMRKKIYNDYVNGGVLDNIRSSDSRTEFKLDSIKVNLNVRPATARVYGKQITIYKTQKLAQPVGAELTIEQLGSGRRTRTVKNPWGMIITKLNFFNYNPTAPKQEDVPPVDTTQAPAITKEEAQ